MNLLTFLTNTGVRLDHTGYIKEKICICNAVALIGFAISFPYIFVSYILYPSLLTYFIVTAVFCLGVIGINAIGFFNLARLVLCLFVSISIAFLYIVFQPAHASPITGLIVLQVAMTVLPWLMFDLGERKKMAFTLGVHCLCLISMRVCSGWIETHLDSAFLHEPAQEVQFILASAVILCACVGVLQKSHLRAKIGNSQLIEEMQNQQTVLQEKEERLSRYIAEVEEAQRVNEQRQWASDGLALFADILRRESSDPARLYEILITQIVRYLKANQGGLFLLQNQSTEEAHVELAACYAYERKKYLNKRIEIGEGLIGQAVQEVDTLYLTDIPQEYISITSGLGRANPTSLLIIPLKVNDQVEGVLELASFDEIAPYQIEFLQKLGESIAATIATARINARTQKLLDDSQWQTEALRAQEEEMRQNMEELAATQEEIERKTKEMEQLYEQSQQREIALTNSLQVLENTRHEMESKQRAIEALLAEAQRNEEQLRQQEDILRATLEEIEAARIELENKNVEIEQTKLEEKARAKGQIESQKKIMEKIMDKQKIREAEMHQQLEALRLELEECRKNHS